MAKIKTAPKVALILLGAVGLVYGLKEAGQHGLIPTPGIMKAIVPTKVGDIPRVEDAQVKNVTPVAFPSDSPAHVATTAIRGEIWEWSAQSGLAFANGGPSTTRGSLMEKHKVNLTLIRQDDTTQMQNDLLACAKELSSGSPQCSTGANFVIIMGDGSGQFAAAINPQLEKLGADYKLKVIGSVGYSRGEDAFMAPPEVKSDATKAKGLLVSGVLRDGDWDIALRWAGDNNIKNNPDEKTWDPDALNWINSSDYNVAAADYVAGKCEDRRVVKDGKPTGETKHVCVGATVTWTPGDVTVATKKGGLVKIVSSREYSSQMPAVIIGPGKFFRDNRDEFEGLLAAAFEGADQIKAFDKALHKATSISADLYKDKDADDKYWYKYFHGVTESDTQGLRVALGGSAVNDLADNEILFGITPGTNDNFRSTYTMFAGIATQQYPAIFKSTPIPDVKDVEDKSFIKGASNVMDGSGAAAETVDYASQESGPVVGARDYNINFDTGKATFQSDGLKTMQALKDSFATSNLYITIDGFTDNTGSESANLILSVARANAVKEYLQRAAPKNFPNNRFAVSGHGQNDPVGDNATSSGKAANRRVKITLSGR